MVKSKSSQIKKYVTIERGSMIILSALLDVEKVQEQETSSVCSKHLAVNQNRSIQFYVQAIDCQRGQDHVEGIIVEEIVGIEDDISLNGALEIGQR